MEHGLIICKVILQMMLPDIPEDIDIQLQRQEFVCSKLLDDQEDEMETPEEGDALSNEAACVIYNYDEDTTLKVQLQERDKAKGVLRRKKKDLGEEEEKMMPPSDEVGSEMVALGVGGAEETKEL